MPTNDQLKTAYNRTALQREGISFDEAMQSPMFKICLQRLAETTDLCTKTTNRPRQPAWLPYKD